MSTRDEFKQAMLDFQEVGQKATLRWTIVKEVDWNEKTMTATGLSDDLDYFDVQLGAGAIVQKPVTGTVALVGIVENEEALAFLISASEVEKIEIRTGSEIEIDGGESGGLVLAPALVGKLNTIEDDINTLKQVLSAWSPVPQDGGASLKGAISRWAGKTLKVSKQDEIENNKIKQ